MPPTYLNLQFYYKRDSGAGVFLQILQNLQEHLFCRTLSPDDYFLWWTHFGLHMRKLILVMAVICLYFTLNFFICRNTQQYWQSLACYNNFLLYNKQKILVQFPKNCFDCKKHPVTKISTMFLIKAVEQLVVDHLGKWSIQLPLSAGCYILLPIR